MRRSNKTARRWKTRRLNLEYCTIRSPINGRAGQRAVDVGNVVAANSGSLLVIQRLGSGLRRFYRHRK